VDKRIGEILAETGAISHAEIEQTLSIQKQEPVKRRFGEILVQKGFSEDAILRALSLQWNIPVVEAANFPAQIPLNRISYNFLIENIILPLQLTDNTLSIAMGDPSKTDALDSLRISYGYDLDISLARTSDIVGHLNMLHESRDAVMQRLIEDVAEEESAVSEMTEDVSHLRDLAQEKGIIQVVNILIENAVKERASDIHIEPGETNFRVRYRIDGVLYEKESFPVRMQSAVSSRIKLLSQMNIAERRLPQDGRIKSTYAGKSIDIRVSTLPTIYGESIVMRILDKASSFMTLEDLGLDRTLLNVYEEVIRRPYGMILITGPTGSGKSTTLYASLERINSPEKKIITIEEPVEYLMAGINQIPVRPKIGLTFASGLRHIVRQDPDIIMVGEVRDLETAGISIHAALTGHLIFSTLHTNDSPGAITRLMDMGVENYLVSSTLICVMAQRLVRRLCSHCKIPQPAGDEIRAEFGNDINEVWKGQGCEHCSGTGYRGRIGIFELLMITDKLRELIMERATVREIKEMAVATGMRTLRQEGIEKVKRGMTTIDEVMRVTQVEL
jgi:general secretion pathway protein E